MHEERLKKRGREMETKRNKYRELEMDDSAIIAPVITIHLSHVKTTGRRHLLKCK